MISKPAGLTFAYMEGKRNNYINPIRFYLFTSAIYFLFINYVVVPNEGSLQTELSEELTMGSPDDQSVTGVSKGNTAINPNKDSTQTGGAFNSEFASFEAYKTHQATLNPKDRASDFELRLVEKFYEVKGNYKDGTSFFAALAKEIVSRLPQLLLLTLPLMALLSKLIFFRRRDYWYMDHLTFILHAATSLFFLLFIQHGLGYLAFCSDQSWIKVLAGWLGVVWIGYYLISFKRFFGKGWGKTLMFLMWLSFWQSILLTAVFALLAFVSFFSL